MKKLYIFADNLFAHECLHFLSGIIMFFVIFNFLGEIKYGIIAFLVSLLIDTDHYFEGLIYNRFRIDWIFNTYPHIFWQKFGKMTILFHSWELLLLILTLGKIFNQQSLAIAIVVPSVVHYSIDNIIYSAFRQMPVLEYFLTFRIYNRFNLKKASTKNE